MQVRAVGAGLMARAAMRRPAARTCLGAGLVVLDVIYTPHAAAPRCRAGGSCCNVLTILAWLGWRSCPVARLGDDPDAGAIMRDMSSLGVDLSHVARDPLIATPRIIQRQQGGPDRRHAFFFRCGHGRMLPRWRPPDGAGMSAALDGVPAPHVFYFDRATRGALDMAGRCRRAGALVVFEPPRWSERPAFVQCMRLADVVKGCGSGRGTRFAPWTDAPAGGQLRIATASEDGLEYEARLGGRAFGGRLPAVRAGGPVVDAAGAGDWLTAGFLHALPARAADRASAGGVQGRGLAGASRASLERALRLGQSLAAINCLYSGARGSMYANEAAAVVSTAEAAAASGEVDPRHLGPARGAGGRRAPGGRCGAYACGAL